MNRHKHREQQDNDLTQHQRLQERYSPKPYHVRNYVFYIMSEIGGWSSNLVSGVTESAKIYALAFGVVGSLAYGAELSFVIMIMGIVGLELVHRTFARAYFKAWHSNGGHSKEQNGNLSAMLLCLTLSTALSITGQFAGLRILIKPPVVAEAKELEVAEIASTLSPIMESSKQRAADYFNQRKWQGRISSEDAVKYKEYLDHAAQVEDSLITAILSLPSRNIEAKEQVRQQYQEDKALYDASIQQKGIGLIFITLPAIFVLYLSLFFSEKFIKKKKDYLQHKFGPIASLYDLTDSQLPYPNQVDPLEQQLSELLQQLGNTPTKQDQLLQQIQELLQQKAGQESANGQSEEIINQYFPPIGYKTTPQKQALELLQYVATRQKTFPDDKYTILHFNFKTGEPIRYTKDRVDWYVKHYNEQVAEAEIQQLDNRILSNRRTKQIYWQARQQELNNKLGIGLQQS